MDTIKLLLDELKSNDKMIEILQQRQKLLHSQLGIALSESRSVSDENADTDTEGEEDEQEVQFDETRRTIQWKGGKIMFRKDAGKLFRFIKLVYESGEEGIEHAEIAEIIYGDPLAAIANLIQRAKEKLAYHNFFANLENDGKILRLS